MNHFNKKGNPYIVDVSNKNVTERSATAIGEIKFKKETYKKIQSAWYILLSSIWYSSIIKSFLNIGKLVFFLTRET